MSAIRIVIVSALATAALLKGVPALAEPAPAQTVSIVRTSDLDLSTNAGKRQLDRRFVVAAHEVCGKAADVDLAGRNDVRQCRADVLAKARAQGQELASRGGSDSITIAAR